MLRTNPTKEVVREKVPAFIDINEDLASYSLLPRRTIKLCYNFLRKVGGENTSNW